MKDKEFNLSEEDRLFLKNQFWKKEEDIKEFIKIILEDCNLHFNAGKGLLHPKKVEEIVNKRAGDKLT